MITLARRTAAAALLLATALAGCFNPKGNAGGSTDVSESGPVETMTTDAPTSMSTTTTDSTPPTTLPSQTEATITSEPPTGTATDVTTGVITSTEPPPPPTCGNGELDPQEDCDDGDDDDTDDCLNNCTVAQCGDGVVHAIKEQCDDGPDNASDAPCTLECKTNVCGDELICPECGEECDGGGGCQLDKCEYTFRYMFVTSDVYQPPDIGGLDGADMLCTKAAAQIDALVGRNFVAWLSSAQLSAGERIGTSLVEYRRTDGGVIAVDTADLLNIEPPLLAAIDRNEGGQQVIDGLPVWTGTQADGKKSNAIEMCNDWTSQEGTGRKGTMTSVMSTWTDDGTIACTEKAHLYCVQVGVVADP